jgi:hypothetical protein
MNAQMIDRYQNRTGRKYRQHARWILSLALAAGLFMGFSSNAQAATRTASVSGNWSATATWGGAAVPTASDDVIINSGISVTVDGNYTCLSLTYAAVTASSTVTISGSNSLTVTGLISMPRPSGGQTATLAVGAGALTAGSLTMNATTAGRNNIISISTGMLTITGTVTTGTTGCQFNFTGAGTLNFGGTFSGGPAALTSSTGTVNYTGNAAVIQAFSGNYYNLTFSGSGTTSGPASGTITIRGNLSNTGGGTLNFSARPVTLSGTEIANNIAGFTTTGLVSMTKTAGIATFTGNVNGAGLTINGTGGTLSLGSGLTHTFTGIWTRTAGTLDGGSSTVTLGASVSGTGGTFTAGTGMVNWNAAGAQTIAAVTYNNLTLSGSGAKTLPNAAWGINGNLIIAGTSTATTRFATTVGGNLDVQAGTTFTVAGFNMTVNGTTTVSGTLAHSSATGTKTYTGLVAINTGGALTNSGSSPITFGSGLTNNGSFAWGTGVQTVSGGNVTHAGTAWTTGTGSFTFSGGGQQLVCDGTHGFTIPTLTVNNTVTNNCTGGLTVSTSLAGSSTLTQAANAILNLSAASTITALNCTTNTPNTVNYNGAAQTLTATAYYNLIFSGSGAKTMPAGTSVSGNLSIAPSGTATASIAAAQNLNISSLTRGSLGSINSTWGGTGSGATYIDTAYFAATTGKLTVLNDTRAPSSVTGSPTGAAITYGAVLSTSALSGGSGSPAGGTFSWTNGATVPDVTTTTAGVTYTPTAGPAGLGSYTPSTGAGNITVNKRPVTLTGTRVYDGTTNASYSILSVSNKVGSDTVTVATGSGTLAAATAGPESITSVGTLALGGAQAGNYTLTGATGSVTINKATPTLSVTNSPATYDGTGKSASVSGSVSGSASNILTGGAITQTSAGTYAVTADFTPTDTTNYNSLTGASAGDFIINKATPTLSVTNSPATYDGTSKSATVSGSVSGTASSVLTGGSATQTNAGTYAVTANFTPTDTTNYNSLTSASAGNFIINMATPTLSVTNSPVTYDGTAKSASVSGSVSGSASNVVTGGAATQTNAGSYAVTADFTPVDTTNYSSLTGASAGNFIISKATPTLSVTNSPVIYSGSAQAAIVSGSVSGSASNIKYNGSGTAPTDAATYTITADFTPTDTTNYNSLTSASAGNLIINKATPTLSVTNSPVTYDGTAKSATVSGSVSGSVSSVLTGGAATQTSAGIYPVNANFTPTDTTNYNSLTGASAGNFVIDKATPTLSVANSPVTYDGTAKSASVSGSVSGSASTVLTGGAATQTNAGTYAVTANFTPTDTTNYNSLTGASAGNFVIDKATPTLSITNSPVTYDGTGRSASVSGSVSGTSSSVLTGGATTQTNAGTYAVTANFTPTDTANYNSLTGASAGNFIINKATPTLSVTNSPVTYDGSAKSATVSGSVSGTASSVLTGGAATQTNAGTYAVTANFTPSDATNYNSLTGASAGNFIINKATPTLSVANSPVTYNGSAQAATVSGSVSGSASNIKYNGSGTLPTNAATYAITADFSPTDTTNYNSLTGASAGNFIINKATPTLSVMNSPATYDGTAKSATVSGSVSGTASSVLTGGAATQTNAGTYAVTASFTPTDITNYNGLTGASAGNFIISKATPTLSVSNSPVTYTGSAQAATVAGSVTGNANNVKYNGSGTVPANAATYTITADFTPTDTTNYNSLTTASAGNFTINKAALTITAATNSKTYDRTTTATAIPGLSGLQGTDMVTGLAEAYTDLTAGTNKTLTVTAYTVSDGNGGNNYTVMTVNDTTGVITAKTLTVTGITANSKEYDGTASATVDTGSASLVGVISPDVVNLYTGSAAGSFADANVGTNKPVTISGLSLTGGADAANYAITQPVTTASITDTIPVFSATSPANDSYINTATVGYALSKTVVNGTGSIAFWQTGGTPDPGSPRTYTMSGSDFASGIHTIDTNLSLVNGAIYDVTFSVSDDQLVSAATVTNRNILFDASAASVTLVAPASSTRVNNAVVAYSLSKDVASGSIVYAWTGGTADSTPHTYSLTGNALLSAGTHTVDTGFSLVDGAVYRVDIRDAVDLEGNASATVSNTAVTYDTTAVAITFISPAAGSAVTNAVVSYSMSEQAGSGTVTFTRTGGAPDNGSHVYAMAGSDLASGTHTDINTSLSLVDGTLYTVSIDVTDLAGNHSVVSHASVTFDTSAPVDGTVTAAPGNMQNILSWTGFTDAASGVSSYTLVSSPTATPVDCSGPSLYTGSDTTYTDTPLTNYVTYYYRICATDNAGNMSAGATAQALPKPDVFSITTQPGSNGSITCDPMTVNSNGSSECSITPNANYHVVDVLVDGSSVGAVAGYTFNNVTADHTIAATFAIDTRTITASAGANGSISPSGAISVNYGASQGFDITPDAGYALVSLVTGSGCGGTYSGTTYTTGAITVDCTITAGFGLISEGFESGDLNALPWVTGGNGNWSVQGAVKHDGNIAAQSGPIANGQTSYLEVTLNITSPGYVYFWLKTSTEPRWDTLKFRVDGSSNYGKWDGWSGATDWLLAKSTFPIATGIHTFRWEYARDASGSGGSDAVWIDSIILPSYGLALHTATPSAGSGGSISPAAPVTVNHGSATSFTVTPDANYHIAGVTGCGGTLSANTYTTGPITGDCTVTANFAINTNTITASADSYGSISPAGAVSVAYGASQGFTITPNANYHVADVLVDGLSVGAVTSYTFTNVTTAHTIAATMAADVIDPLVFSSTSPAAGSYVNTDAIGYTLSRLVTNGSGTVTFTWAGGNPDGNSPHSYSMTTADMTAGSHAISSGWSSGSGGLVNGAIYTVTFNVIDGGAYSAPTVTNTDVLYDASAASVTLIAPAASSVVNNATIDYTLSKNAASGTVVYLRTGGAADGASHTYTLSGAELASGPHTVATGLALVDGAVYTASIENVVDLEGNASASVANTSVTYDVASVAISGTLPGANTALATETVSYTLSEQASAGRITFTRTGGTADNGSPRMHALSGSELIMGAHTVNTTLGLVDGTIYTVSFDATDQAGNAATTVSNAGITFDTTAPLDGTVTAAPGNMENVLTWAGFTDAASGISGYTLVSSQTATPADCSGTPLFTGSGTTFAHTGLTNGMTYYYRVCATDQAGNISAGATAQAAPRPDTYTVTTQAGPNGSISCSPASVTSNGSSQCAITPNTGYHVADVSVGPTGGTLHSVGAVTEYAIDTIVVNMTIAAAFASNTYDVTTAPGPNGNIACSPTTVNYNSGSTCTITPDAGYYVADVAVGPTGGNLSSVGAVTLYTIRNVAANMTIAATFSPSSGSVTPPTARFTWRTDAAVNYKVLYDASASICPVGATCTYIWSTGETGMTASHTFDGTATATVTLTVSSNLGGNNSTSLAVTPAYVAEHPTSLGAGVTVTPNGFSPAVGWSVSDGIAPYTVRINWGDGTIVAVTQPTAGPGILSHTYSISGNFTVTVYVTDSGANGINVTTATASTGVTIAPVSVSGLVKSSTGIPLSGVSLSLQLSGVTKKVTTTAADGTYALTNVAPGTYTLTATKSGCTFASPAVTGIVVTGTANVIGVNFSANAAPAVISASGTVYKKDGITPLSGVALSMKLGTVVKYLASTDASGNYTFTNVAAGSYTITATKSGYAFASPAASVTVGGTSVTGLNINATGP